MNGIRGATRVIREIFGGLDGWTNETAEESKVLRVEGRGVVSADPDIEPGAVEANVEVMIVYRVS